MNTSTVQLHDDETVIATIRRHWFHLALVGLVDAFVFILLLAGLGAIDAFAMANVSAVFGLAHSLALSLFVLAGGGLLLWMHFFAAWTDHWLDAWLITNQRIIDIEQKGFFSREVSSFPLDRIQDVTYEMHGIIAMWLHFGDVRVQTASITSDLIMRQVPFPEDVKEHVALALQHHAKRNL